MKPPRHQPRPKRSPQAVAYARHRTQARLLRRRSGLARLRLEGVRSDLRRSVGRVTDLMLMTIRWDHFQRMTGLEPHLYYDHPWCRPKVWRGA